MHAGAPSLRFYPEYMPAFEHEPTRDRFHIGFEGDSFGEGVRSLVPFAPGDVVFACTGFFSSHVTQYTLQVGDGLHLHDPFFYGKILHSCVPNTVADVATRRFTAVKPIEPGHFVTMDYAQTEDYLFRTFPCACGARNCRRNVVGRKQLAPPEPVAAPSNIVPLTELVTAPMGLFEVLNDANRKRILSLLLDSDLRLQDVMALSGLGYSAVSKQLRILRQMGLVSQYKLGRQVFYAQDDERMRAMLEAGREHVNGWLGRVGVAKVRAGG